MSRLDKIRNIGIIAHIDAGKTTVSERLLFCSGKTHRIGEVHDGTATMDWMEQEQERGITITSAVTSFVWKNANINLIDTPGHVDFTIEVDRSLRVLDGAIGVFCAVAGVQPQTETVWRQANKYNVPRIAFINKMDRVGANFSDCVNQIESKLKVKTAVVQLPIFVSEKFMGILDVINEVKLIWNDDSDIEFKKQDLNFSDIEILQNAREDLVSKLSDFDESLMDLYLSGKSIQNELLKKVLRKAVIAKSLVPVLCGSAFKNKGIQPLMDAIELYLPSPTDRGAIIGFGAKDSEKMVREPKEDEFFCGIAFKIFIDSHVGMITCVRIYSGKLSSGSTIFNANKNVKEKIQKIFRLHAGKKIEIQEASAGDIIALSGLKQTYTGETLCDPSARITLDLMKFPDTVISVAIEPKMSIDEQRLNLCLALMKHEDPTFNYGTNKNTGQLLVYGMGELHLEIILERLKREHGINVNTGKPQVFYKESVSQSVTVDEKFNFPITSNETAESLSLKITISPIEISSVDECDIKISESIKKNPLFKPYIEAISTTVKDGLSVGALCSFPVIRVKCDVESISFFKQEVSVTFLKMALSEAIHKCLVSSVPVLMEPFMKLEVVIPVQYSGETIAELSLRRARIISISPSQDSSEQIVTCFAPMAELFGFSTILRSKTQGRGQFSLQFAHYEKLSMSAQELLLKSWGFLLA